MKNGPWFQAPPPLLTKGGAALIIGAGLAGATCARALAERGINVTLFDRRPLPGQETSGNPAGVLLPFAALDNDALSRFYDLAFPLAWRQVSAMEENGAQLACRRSGVVHLLNVPRLERLHAQCLERAPKPYIMPLTPRETDRITGLSIGAPSLYYPQGGYLDPAALCRSLIDHKLVTFVGDVEVADFVFEEGVWHLYNAERHRIGAAPVLVLANAVDANRLLSNNILPMRTTLGQLALVDQGLAPKPRTVICHRDYLIPDVRGDLLLGATWRPDEGPLTMLAQDQACLIQLVCETLPGLSLPKAPPLRGRVGRRCTTADHLPLVGPVPDRKAFEEAYCGLHLGRESDYPAGPYIPGLFASLAHGSRGLLSTPASALLLAARITGAPMPFPISVENSLNPARYLMRYLKRDPKHRRSYLEA